MFQAVRNEDGEFLRYAFKGETLLNDKDYGVISEVVCTLTDSMDTDSAYAFTVEALDILSECETEEEAEGRILELGPDVYTHDLTAWINRSVKNVEYITEALKEYNPEDGFKLLSSAQSLAKRQAARAVLTCLLGETQKDTESES